MSQRSARLAAYARQFLESQPQTDAATLQRNKILDEGFSRLRGDLEKELNEQTDELNHEPSCVSALSFGLSGDRPVVSRTDDHEAFLAVKLDRATRTATLSCEKPVKFKYFMEVKLSLGGTEYYFVVGPKKTEMSALTDISWIVDKGLYALFGVET